MMKKYEHYKPTGLKYVPYIPSNWSILKNKSFLFEKKDVNKDNNGLLLSLSQYTGITLKKDDDKQGMFRAESLLGYRIVKKDDIVMNIMLAWNGSTACSKFEGVISPAYAVFSIKNDFISPRFLDYFFRLPATCGYFKAYSTGIINSRLRLYPEIFMQLFSIIPPREEQDQIVRFLDYKISKINSLIKGYQKQIKLLKERRANVIELAVTQGIDDSVELKDSGAHWLPKIPKHWNMVYSKKLFAQRKDKAFPGDMQLTSSQKYGIISQDEYMRIEGRRLTVVMTGADILKHVGKGDFVISMRSFQGGLEYSYVEGKISSAYVMLIPDHEKVYDEYFKWLLKSKSYIKALQGTSDLVRDGQALRYANFAKVSLPEIPLDEQKAIAEYIESEVNKIDEALPFFQKQIDLLREYRTRLISDVVTGQIDVRDEVIPEYTAVEDEPEQTEENEENNLLEDGEENI